MKKPALPCPCCAMSYSLEFYYGYVFNLHFIAVYVNILQCDWYSLNGVMVDMHDPFLWVPVLVPQKPYRSKALNYTLTLLMHAPIL